ncbi:MAG: EutN/CcmL family microcompartment protein [Planctomycetota bacterium]|jgi:ethanolamine utilization protein EutN
MYLARVIGRLVATQSYEGLAKVPYQLIQPLDESGADAGAPLVACTAISSGPGDFVTYVDGREAALALEETFVPVDACIMGFVEQADVLGEAVHGKDGN